MIEQWKTIQEKIEDADAVLCGIGSGMSSSAGYNHYHKNSFFEENFSEFSDQYGFDNLFHGFYHVYPTPERQWAYYAKYIQTMHQAPAGKAYEDLKQILLRKEYHILTTNVDMQLSKVFPEDKVFCFQGDFRYLQCCQPCSDEIYPGIELIDQMVSQTEDLQVPSELIPRCPKCGWKMVPWVQDDTFLHGSYWKKQEKEYHAFLEKYRDQKLVLLELGVGEMTPSVIKYPFWNMIEKHPDTTLIAVNQKSEKIPEFLKARCIDVQDDITEFLEHLKI